MPKEDPWKDCLSFRPTPEATHLIQDDGYYEALQSVTQRIKEQPNSLAASGDEVRICWLICMVDEMHKQIKDAEAAFLCTPVENALNILKGGKK